MATSRLLERRDQAKSKRRVTREKSILSYAACEWDLHVRMVGASIKHHMALVDEPFRLPTLGSLLQHYEYALLISVPDFRSGASGFFSLDSLFCRELSGSLQPHQHFEILSSPLPTTSWVPKNCSQLSDEDYASYKTREAAQESEPVK